MVCNGFSNSVSCLSSLPWWHPLPKFLIFRKPNMSFSFVAYAFGIISKKPLPNPSQEDLQPFFLLFWAWLHPLNTQLRCSFWGQAPFSPSQAVWLSSPTAKTSCTAFAHPIHSTYCPDFGGSLKTSKSIRQKVLTVATVNFIWLELFRVWSFPPLMQL